MSGKHPLTPQERQALEASYTFRRIVELRLDPVRGKFDTAHLKEINRRIFQDLPGAGFDDVTPGEFRKPVPAGKDWMKTRELETVGALSHVAYSPMDTASQNQLESLLQQANPEKLGRLKTADFTQALGNLYAQADYIHPFSDGNSRTLREFTRQLSESAGYSLDWERFGRSPAGRDVLYIARDRSVNELAFPKLQDESTKRAINTTMYQFEGNRALPDLLRDAVRPSRAVAFEREAEDKALEAHPELTDAYATLRAASQYFVNKMPNDEQARQRAIEAVRGHVLGRLDAGEVRDFHEGSSGRIKTLPVKTKAQEHSASRSTDQQHDIER